MAEMTRYYLLLAGELPSRNILGWLLADNAAVTLRDATIFYSLGWRADRTV